MQATAKRLIHRLSDLAVNVEINMQPESPMFQAGLVLAC
jgi:hypothetical protein